MRRFGGLLLSLALAACAPASAPLPTAPIPAGPDVAVAATQVALGAPTPPNWRFAGGLQLSSSQTSRLHGLSDLEVSPAGRLIAVNDEGELLSARLVLDRDGGPIGLAEASLTPLRGPDGQPLQDKADADAEGLAILPGGDMLVSFERRHRIWLYPAGGGSPRAVPSPDGSFPNNGGMEALASAPEAGRDAYIVGGEDSGETWLCRLSAACVKGPTIEKGPTVGLVAARRLPGGRTAWLLRGFDPIRGPRIELRISDAEGLTIDQLMIVPPALVDNFEGLSAVPGASGAVRFYLVSDDNFSPAQKTLLYAYDWRPPAGR